MQHIRYNHIRQKYLVTSSRAGYATRNVYASSGPSTERGDEDQGLVSFEDPQLQKTQNIKVSSDL